MPTASHIEKDIQFVVGEEDSVGEYYFAITGPPFSVYDGDG